MRKNSDNDAKKPASKQKVKLQFMIQLFPFVQVRLKLEFDHFFRVRRAARSKEAQKVAGCRPGMLSKEFSRRHSQQMCRMTQWKAHL